MMNAIAIGFAGHHVDFELDHDAHTWVPALPAAADLLDDDGMFPLIGVHNGNRYHLYADGTFDEARI